MVDTHESAPTDVAVKKVPLPADAQAALETALSLIDEEKMRQFNLNLTAIHSPTGYEREASEWLADYMEEIGLSSMYQAVDEDSGNAIGRLPGTGEGPSLMLYAPIDTHLEAEPDKDLPWAGPEFRAEMLPDAYLAENGDVIGLGSSNPKGMITAIGEAVRVVAAAGILLKGDVIWAACGGGMPTKPPDDDLRQDHGLGSGVSYMINHGTTADFGIIIKPGWSVAWEEVGLCWFKVTVRGDMGYAGYTRGLPGGFRNSVVHASRVIQALEAWLPQYQERNTSGLCSPQGAIASVRGGWPHKPAFPSAATEIFIDMRVNPRVTPANVEHQFAEVIKEIRAANPDIELDWEMYAAYPGASTDPENWIVQSSMRAWEYAEGGKEHHAATRTAGQTDASAIRNLGIPLARFGMPMPVPTTPPDWMSFGGMGVSYIPDLAKVTRALVYAIIDTCWRDRAEVGL